MSLISNDGIVPFGGLCVPEVCSPDLLARPAFRYKGGGNTRITFA